MVGHGDTFGTRYKGTHNSISGSTTKPEGIIHPHEYEELRASIQDVLIALVKRRGLRRRLDHRRGWRGPWVMRYTCCAGTRVDVLRRRRDSQGTNGCRKRECYEHPSGIFTYA